MARLNGAGFEVRHNPLRVSSPVVVVNTCGFIGDAKEESINMILSMLDMKKKGKIGKVIVMGCLTERYMSDLKRELPEVDAWFGKFDWGGITDFLNPEGNGKIVKPWDRIVSTAPHYAYVKISEGCNRKCAFCAIPFITGPHHSRPKTQILDEVRGLAEKGVREFNIIAQDLSSYGLDLDHRQELPRLIDEMAGINGVEWIRLHYAYPAQFPMEILKVISQHDNVCSYLDIALQHISDTVLKNMRRHITSVETRKLIEKIRESVPEIHLRTTLMVGFPGEGDKEFEELLDFVSLQKFERMGAFAYSEEDDTWAAKTLPDIIPDKVKQERLDRLMVLQESISDELQRGKIGKRLKVIIDREENEFYVGRTQWDSPDVDPEVLVTKSKKLIPGEFYDIKITSAFPFELYGEVAD